jgi:hypothetical protein
MRAPLRETAVEFLCRIPLARLQIQHSLRAVTFVARLLALWLAAFWLPLTMHCQLAGMPTCQEKQACSDHPCGCSDGGDCQSDVCKIVETGKYFSQKDTSLVPAASWDVTNPLERAAANFHGPMPVATLTEATGAPPGWSQIWQFVLRAAPAPRAPAASC